MYIFASMSLHKNFNHLHKPPILTHNLAVYSFSKYADVEEAVDLLLANEYVLLLHSYADGLRILAALKQHIGKTAKNFQDKRQRRAIYQQASQHLLVEIEQHRIRLKKAPQIPFLEPFYAQEPYFCISFPHLQGLNSAWQWYQKGIQMPGLSGKLYPFYGVYFPTRFEHIDLFNHYIRTNNLNGKRAIEVGVGSGILSLLLLQAGIHHIQATDCNPNALYSCAEAFAKRGLAKQVQLLECDLMTDCHSPADLIVFNPPWLEAKHITNQLDQAIYYSKGMFQTFFKQAEQLLSPSGKIIILFSQLGQSSGHQKQHPIASTMKNSKVWKVNHHLEQYCQATTQKKPSKNWRQRQHKEIVELWEIQKSDEPTII